MSGDCKTIATYPWNSTHAIMTEADRINVDITEGKHLFFSFSTFERKRSIADFFCSKESGAAFRRN